MEPNPLSGNDPIGYFADRAHAYARWRPGYPEAAIQQVLGGLEAPRVVDVGCGTGISTRALFAAGCQVLGVEPDARMRAAAEAAGGPSYAEGRAEHLPVEDGSQDLVVVAQAFHWFNREPALREFHRVLRPGGRLALLWNVRAKDTPFMTAYSAVVSQAQWHTERTGRVVSRDRCASPDESTWFGAAEHHTVANTDALSWEAVAGRISSASYFPSKGPARERFLEELKTAFDAHAVDGQVQFVQSTELTLALRT